MSIIPKRVWDLRKGDKINIAGQESVIIEEPTTGKTIDLLLVPVWALESELEEKTILIQMADYFIVEVIR